MWDVQPVLVVVEALKKGLKACRALSEEPQSPHMNISFRPMTTCMRRLSALNI